MNHSVALIIFARQARKIKCPVKIRFVHGGAASCDESARKSRAIVAADARRL
jgi:hypothetical protein